MRKSTSRNSGFTLLEVLIALFILSVGIMALVQLFPTSLRQTRISAERTDVGNLASSKLERLRADGISGLAYWMKENTVKSLDTITRAYTMYEGWQSSVQRVMIGPDLYRVTFIVNLPDGRQESFITYVTKE